MITVHWAIDHPNLLIAVVEARGVTIQPSGPELTAEIEALVKARGDGTPGGNRGAIRDLLRFGGHKPSGRGKPASEYLAAVAQKGTFPAINNVVDVNNYFSLMTGWPMSVLDLPRALGDTDALEVRFGRPDERYVFNASGQEISLRGLLSVGQAEGVLIGNPVRDAMTAKTNDASVDLVTFIYTSAEITDAGSLLKVAERYADALKKYASATSTEAWVLPSA